VKTMRGHPIPVARLVGVVLTLGLATPGAAAPAPPARAPAPSLRAEVREGYLRLFERWKSLPLPDITGKPRVRVLLQGMPPRRGAVMVPSNAWPLSDRGHLLEEDAGRFTVLLDSWKTASFIRRPSPSDAVAYTAASHQPLDLTTEIRELLQAPEKGGFRPSPGAMTDPVYYAYLAHRQRLTGVDALLQRAEQMKGRFPGEPKDAIEMWHGRRARTLLWSAAVDIRSGRPWEEARVQSLFIKEHFATSLAGVQAAELALELARAEQEEAQPVASPPIEALLGDLRRQRGDVGLAAPDTEPFPADSPAGRVLALGLEAAPHLLRLLDDTRLTRMVALSPTGAHVVRRRDVAIRILEHLAARTFLPRTGGLGTVTPTVASAARAWWESVQARGERATLSAGVTTGADRVYQARRLIARYPLDALPPLERAIGEAVAPLRLELIQELAALPEARGLLFRLLREPVAGTRLTAARALLEQGDLSGVYAVLEALQTLAPETAEAEPDSEPVEEGALDAYLQLSEFVAETGEEWAQEAAFRALEKAPANARATFLDSLSEATSPPSRIFALALDDRRHIWEYYFEQRGVELPAPRVCDVAAVHLARTLQDAAEPEPRASLVERDAEIERVRAAWRREAGLPAGAPLGRRPAPSPAAPRLVRLLAAGGGDAARRPVLALAAAAVPALRRAADAPATSAGATERLMGVWREIANRVAAVEVSGVPSGHAAATLVQGWRGRAVDLRGIAQLLVGVARQTWPEVGGCEVILDRPLDGTGVRVSVVFAPGASDPDEGAGVLSVRTMLPGKDGVEASVEVWPLPDVERTLTAKLQPHLQDPRRDFVCVLNARRASD